MSRSHKIGKDWHSMRIGSFRTKILSVALAVLAVWTQVSGCSSTPANEVSGESAEQRMNSALQIIANQVKARCSDGACESAAAALPIAVQELGERAKNGVTALFALPRASETLRNALVSYQADVYSRFKANDAYRANFMAGFDVVGQELVRRPGTLLALAKSYFTARDGGTPHHARALVAALATTNFAAQRFDIEAFRGHLQVALGRADQAAGMSSASNVASAALGPLAHGEQAVLPLIALVILLLGAVSLVACAPSDGSTPTQAGVQGTPEGFSHDIEYNVEGTAVAIDLSNVDHGEDGVGQGNRMGLFRDGQSWGAFHDAVFWVDWVDGTTIEFATDMVVRLNPDRSRGEELPVIEFTHHPQIQIVKRDDTGVQTTGYYADIQYYLNIFARPDDPVQADYVQASRELEALNSAYGQVASTMNSAGQQLYTRIEEGNDCDGVTDAIRYAEFDAHAVVINGQTTYHIVAVACADKDGGEEGATIAMPRYRFPAGIAPVYVHIVAVGPASDAADTVDVSIANTLGEQVVIPFLSPAPNTGVNQVTTTEGIVVNDLQVGNPLNPADGSAAIAIMPHPNTSTAEALVAIDAAGDQNGVPATEDWLSQFVLVAARDIAEGDGSNAYSFDDRQEGECWGLIPDWFPISCSELKLTAVKFIAQLVVAYLTGGAAPPAP